MNKRSLLMVFVMGLLANFKGYGLDEDQTRKLGDGSHHQHSVTIALQQAAIGSSSSSDSGSGSGPGSANDTLFSLMQVAKESHLGFGDTIVFPTDTTLSGGTLTCTVTESTGDLSVTGDVVIDIETATAGFEASENLTINTTGSAPTFITGNVIVNGDFTVESSLTIVGDLTVFGSIEVNGTAELQALGNLHCHGKSSDLLPVDSKALVDSSATLIVGNNALFEGFGQITMTGVTAAVEILGDLEVGGNLTVRNNASSENGADIKGIVKGSAYLLQNAGAGFNPTNKAGTRITDDFTVGGDLYVCDNQSPGVIGVYFSPLIEVTANDIYIQGNSGRRFGAYLWFPNVKARSIFFEKNTVQAVGDQSDLAAVFMGGGELEADSIAFGRNNGYQVNDSVPGSERPLGFAIEIRNTIKAANVTFNNNYGAVRAVYFNLTAEHSVGNISFIDNTSVVQSCIDFASGHGVTASGDINFIRNTSGVASLPDTGTYTGLLAYENAGDSAVFFSSAAASQEIKGVNVNFIENESINDTVAFDAVSIFKKVVAQNALRFANNTGAQTGNGVEIAAGDLLTAHEVHVEVSGSTPTGNFLDNGEPQDYHAGGDLDTATHTGIFEKTSGTATITFT